MVMVIKTKVMDIHNNNNKTIINNNIQLINKIITKDIFNLLNNMMFILNFQQNLIVLLIQMFD